MPADLYDVLGVSHDASAEELKRAYRERVREYHPDVNDHPEGDAQFKLVRKAHDVLSDPAERKDYDRLGHREYVEKHLDGLPPVSVFPDEDLPDEPTTEAESGDASTDTSTATTTASGGSTQSGSTTSSSAGSASEQSGGVAGDESTSGASASSGTSSGSGASASSTGADERTTTAGAERSGWDAATGPAQSTTSSESTSSDGVRRRRGLKRWYGVVVLSLLAYLGGLGAYAMSRQAALEEFVSSATAAPVSTLTGAFPLSSPTEHLLGAVRAATAGTPESGLLLLAGTVLLPLVVLVTVGRFGRGGAWIYALPSLAPAICLAVWPAVAVPAWLALLGLVVLPTLSGVGFLVDVGRYLRATR